MEQENEHRNKRMNASYRPMSELIRGVFFLAIGLFVFFSEKLGLGQISLSPEALYAIGGALCAWGLYRVYRGIKQLFF